MYYDKFRSIEDAVIQFNQKAYKICSNKLCNHINARYNQINNIKEQFQRSLKMSNNGSSKKYRCLQYSEDSRLKDQQLDQDLWDVMQQQQQQSQFSGLLDPMDRQPPPMPDFNYRISHEKEYFQLFDNQVEQIQDLDEDQYDQDIDQQYVQVENTVQKIQSQIKPMTMKVEMISEEVSQSEQHSEEEQNSDQRRSPNIKKDRYDNNVAKMCSRVAVNAFKQIKTIKNHKKILKSIQLNKKIQKRNFIYLLLAYIQHQGKQPAIEQFIKNYSELIIQKNDQINSKKGDSLEKKTFLTQSLKKSFDAMIEYVNGYHQLSIHKMYVLYQGSTIKKKNYYEKGKLEIQKLRAKLKINPLQFKKMQ